MIELNCPLVACDTETTGVHPRVDRICQLGVIKLYPDGQRTEFVQLINPTVPIPPEATAVHGITDERVANEPTFAQLAPKIAGGFKGCDFLAYNSRFDLEILEVELERCGARGYINGRVLDPSKIARKYNPRTLSAMYERYTHKKLEGAHDALTDTRAALELFEAQLAEHPDLPRTVEELHREFFETPEEPNVDSDGKLAWRFGQACINFGDRWAGRPLSKVDPSYLRWMLGANFSQTVKRIVKDALEGRYLRR